MKHYFRKIPAFIHQKIEEIEANITVATIISLTEEEFRDSKYSDIELRIIEGQLSFNSEFVPNFRKGVFSRRNINGYRIKYPEREKIEKTFYAGERPKFGDYSRGTFSLYITKMVIPYDDIPPRELSLLVELLDTKIKDGLTNYVFKIATNQILDKNQADFETELLFNLSLLQENIGSVNVFSSQSTLQEFLNTLHVAWEIFPPGTTDGDLIRIINNVRNLSPARIQEITDRYQFLRNENPINIIVGTSGMLRYFGAQFSDRLIVFENTKYGNALYILFENWRELSHLSRLEIQTRPRDQYIRVIHIGDWQEKVISIISSKRQNI